MPVTAEHTRWCLWGRGDGGNALRQAGPVTCVLLSTAHSISTIRLIQALGLVTCVLLSTAQSASPIIL